MPSRRLEDRIRDLCAKAVSAEGRELAGILRDLKEALREHADRLRKLRFATNSMACSRLRAGGKYGFFFLSASMIFAHFVIDIVPWLRWPSAAFRSCYEIGTLNTENIVWTLDTGSVGCHVTIGVGSRFASAIFFCVYSVVPQPEPRGGHLIPSVSSLGCCWSDSAIGLQRRG